MGFAIARQLGPLTVYAITDESGCYNWRFQWLWLYGESASKYGRNKGVDTALRQ